MIATSDNDKLILDVLCSFEKDMGRYKTILDNVLPTLKTKIKVSEPLTATEM